MHWTALLAYRRFPSNARVIDDMGCIGCGYNLRGLLVSGRCPECGGQVGDSVFLLAEPEIVARGVREIGQSFLMFFALAIGCLGGWSGGWMPMFTAGLMTLSAGWRIVGILELRHRGAIGRLPVVGPRLDYLWWCSLANVAISLVWLIALIAQSQNFSLQTPAFNRLLDMLFMAWLITTVLCAVFAGRLGTALATMLGYGWLAVEFRLQTVAASLCIPAGIFLVMLQNSAWPASTVGFLCVGIFLYAIGAFAFSGVAMLQLASAAFSENETWEDAVDQERIALEPTIHVAEAAPIELAPVPLDPPPPSPKPIQHAAIPKKSINKPPRRSSDS